ncbi:MazG family protein [Bacteroidales bacterium KA00344]|nr:MazG family protein [Bacteroidales bacterium KA00344]
MHQKDRKVHTREDKLVAFGRLLDVQHRLRTECPWDRKQTIDSLRPNTIEEVFELAEALTKHDYHEIMKELGDVMEHVIFYAMLGNEKQEFDIADVCNQEADKLMFRHPFINWNETKGDWNIDNKPFHVVNAEMKINSKGQVVYKSEETSLDDTPETESAVEQTWEQIKQKEKDGNESVLSGVPQALPSLIKAYRIQDKARNVGFDWKKKEDVWEKVREELRELEVELEKEDKENSEKELGDFLFSIINAARLYHLNPDNALEQTNRKFINRFNYIERKAKEVGKAIGDLSLNQMDALWNEAKQLENQNEKI